MAPKEEEEAGEGPGTPQDRRAQQGISVRHGSTSLCPDSGQRALLGTLPNGRVCVSEGSCPHPQHLPRGSSSPAASRGRRLDEA